MKRQVVFLLAFGCLFLGFFMSEARADIIIKVRALNPLENQEVAAIRYPLPKDVVPDDIISKDIKFSLPQEEGEEERKTTFNVEYVEEEERYFIIDKVLLKPKEVVTLEVRVHDIWFIPQERLDSIRQTVEDLVIRISSMAESLPPEDEEDMSNSIEGTYETAIVLKEEILKQLDEIAAVQARSSVLMVGVEKHMDAYYENMEAVWQVEVDVGMLRYLLQLEEEVSKEESEEGSQDVDTTEEIELLEENMPVTNF